MHQPDEDDEAVVSRMDNSKNPKTTFDSDLSPDNEKNVYAARERQLTYDRRGRVYRDVDGCPVHQRCHFSA